MTNPLFLKLDSIIATCEVLIKEYQQIEQQIDTSQSSIFNLFRVKKWKINYQILHVNNSRINTSLSELELFYATHKDKLSSDTNLYIKEYIKYFSSVSYASNLRTKIQKNVIGALLEDVGGGTPRKKGRDNNPNPIQKNTMTLTQLEALYPEQAEWSSYCHQLHQASTLAAMVLIALQLGLLFARMTLEQELNTRARLPTIWPDCPVCGRHVRSKGFRSRQMQTLVGQIT